MENEKDKNSEYVIDVTVFRCANTIDKSLITADDIRTWINSPITKSLLQTLDYYCMTVAMEEKDNGDLVMHLMGQFDIKKGILERDRQARKDLNRYKDGQA